MCCVLLLIVNILGSGSGSGLQIINTNIQPPSANIEQHAENTVVSDIEEEEEEEEEEAEEETFEEEMTEETTRQLGIANKEIGLKQKPGKKKEEMVRPSSASTAADTPSTEDGMKYNFKQKLTDKSKKMSKDNGIEARDKRHRPRKETFTMEAERKSESCEAKTSGWDISMELLLNLTCMILYRVGNQLEH